MRDLIIQQRKAHTAILLSRLPLSIQQAVIDKHTEAATKALIDFVQADHLPQAIAAGYYFLGAIYNTYNLLHYAIQSYQYALTDTISKQLAHVEIAIIGIQSSHFSSLDPIHHLVEAKNVGSHEAENMLKIITAQFAQESELPPPPCPIAYSPSLLGCRYCQNTGRSQPHETSPLKQVISSR